MRARRRRSRAARSAAATAARGRGSRSACSRHTRDRVDLRRRASGTAPSNGSSSAPARVEPPGHLEPQRARHERRGPVDERVVERRPVLARDLDHVGEPARRDERDRAPRRSSSALVATVVPCASTSTARRRRAAPSTRATARAGSSGVDGTLATRPSSATTSVNVPPLSIPSRTLRTLCRSDVHQVSTGTVGARLA